MTITVDESGAQLGSQLVQSDGRLYLIGGFNSSVHRTALAFDIRDNTCYLIKGTFVRHYVIALFFVSLLSS